MISISDLDFHFGSRTLYDGASLHIKPKDKIGLVGLNGTGKSTLLRACGAGGVPTRRVGASVGEGRAVPGLAWL